MATDIVKKTYTTSRPMHGNSTTSLPRAKTPRTCGTKTAADSRGIVDNMSSQYLYGGSCWAAKSFDPDDHFKTNLATEWGIPHTNLTKEGIHVLDSLDRISQHPDKKSPVIFLYQEPLGDIESITGISFEEFLTRKDWKILRDQCNQYCLDKIDSLDRPVLLIGAIHNAVNNGIYKNITVGHINWQLWLAEQAGMEVVDQTVHVTPADGGNYCLNYFWGAEQAQKVLHENPSVKPDKKLLDAIWDVFFFWKELENANLFYEVHPNYNGNKLFAEFLKPTVLKFLNEHK